MVINAAFLQLVVIQSNLKGLRMKRILLVKSADFKHVVIMSHYKLLW